MKNKALIFSFSLLLFRVGAQEVFSFSPGIDTTRTTYTAGLSVWHEQNSIQNNLINPFINPQNISREIRNSNFEKLKSINRAGFELTLFTKVYLPKLKLFGKKSSLIVGLGYQQGLSTAFDQNAYQLFFFGNNQFEGQEIPIKDFNLSQISFSWLQLGTFSRLTHNEISVSIVRANRYLNFHLDQASIFTGTNGSELNYDFQGTYKNSSGSNNQFFKPNGIGFGLNTKFNFNINSNENTKVQLLVQNFGLIFWNNESEIFDENIAENFNGFNANGIFDETNFDLDAQSLIDSLVPDKRKSSFVSALPGWVELNIRQKQGDRFLVNFGFRQKIDVNYITQAFAGIDYNFKGNNKFSFQLAKGGYGGYSLSIGLNLILNGGDNLALKMLEPTGWISGKNKGRGAMAFIKKTLK